MLAALAAHTTRIRCGILVAGNTYRNPGVLANIATTIDHVSGGRLELGLGAGWYEKEHDQFGIPLPPMTKRAQMLSETASILKSLWTQHKTTFKGRHYTITDASCEPKPVQKPYIPLWIGGMGERFTLRVVAEVADGWNAFFMPIEDYKRKLVSLPATAGKSVETQTTSESLSSSSPPLARRKRKRETADEALPRTATWISSLFYSKPWLERRSSA